MDRCRGTIDQIGRGRWGNHLLGKLIDYDYKLVTEADGALTVELKVDDPAMEDTFQQTNITGLVITPDDEFHGYNTNFATQFVRAP